LAVVVESHDGCDEVQCVGGCKAPHLWLSDLPLLAQVAGLLSSKCMLAHSYV
jgi:hypothetical protein